MTLRKSDSLKEKAIAEYLDKYFYSKRSIIGFRRVSNKKLQIAGIDVFFKINNPNCQTRRLYVDEKSAAHYVNKNIKTFAFELQFQNINNIKTIGWLYDSNKKTTHYLLVWVKTNKKNKGFTFKDITELEVMLIARNAVWSILSAMNFNLLNLGNYIQVMLSGDKNLDEKQFHDFGDFELHYPGHLSEKPINVTINKAELKKNCIGHFKVTSSGVLKA